jgi:methylated-DNA-[protein]-cysteine S-methyltransferase
MNLNKSFDSSDSLKTEIGFVNLYAENGKLIGVTIDKAPAQKIGDDPVIEKAKSQLAEYFAGKRKTFDLPIELHGTAFQKSVWKVIDGIKFGETLTYADIADRIGNPKASRAVGGAVGANPVPLIVPCHRVLGANGKITGYSGGEGLPTKRQLLKLEQITSVE